jgi:hypothetical protein
LSGKQPDPLLLAEAKFPQPGSNVRRRVKLFDADHRPGLNPTQRAYLGTGTAALKNLECGRRFLFHSAKTMAIETRLQEGFSRRRVSIFDHRMKVELARRES